MDISKITDPGIHTAVITKLSLITCEGIIAIFLNMIYIIVFCTRMQMRNQTNTLNIGLAASSIALASGHLMKHFVDGFNPCANYWTQIATFMYFQVSQNSL